MTLTTTDLPDINVPQAPDLAVSPATRPAVLLAVDGNSLAHRAFHAYEKSGMTGSDGEPIFAVYGFLALLVGIVEKVAARHGGPRAIVVGFDDHINSVRKDSYPDYKANRSRKDESLYVQMDRIQELLLELGVSVVVAEGWEADDVVASAAETAEQDGWRCVIATSDRDSFQLISDQTDVLRLVSGLDNAQWLTPSELVTKYGVAPERYVEYAALRGDTSDNLPGVPGVGEKRASALCGMVPSLEAAFSDLATCTKALGARGAKSFVEHEDAVRRNLSLMAARRDLPISLTGAELTLGVDELAGVVVQAGLPNLAGRVATALTGGDGIALVEPGAEYFEDSYLDEDPFDFGGPNDVIEDPVARTAVQPTGAVVQPVAWVPDTEVGVITQDALF